MNTVNSGSVRELVNKLDLIISCAYRLQKTTPGAAEVVQSVRGVLYKDEDLSLVPGDPVKFKRGALYS